MSNFNDEMVHNDIDSLLHALFDQYMKNLHTVLPGEIISYDTETRRARIKPSISLVKTDGAEMARAELINIPVVTPGGGNWLISVNLMPGNQVICLFSERGINAFKETFTESSPDVDSFFSEKDAIAIPAFGPLSIVPVSNGIALQHISGDPYISMDDDHVRARRGNQSIELTDTHSRVSFGGNFIEATENGININTNGPCQINSSSLRHNTKNVGDDHGHPYFWTMPAGSDTTGAPN